MARRTPSQPLICLQGQGGTSSAQRRQPATIPGEDPDPLTEPIWALWRISKGNRLIEDFHNKMEMIASRASGF